MFYITGGLGIVWYLFWFLLVTDEPKDHRWIRQKEVEYIESNRPKVKEHSGVPPYCQILMCPAVWTIMACDFANGWGLFVLLNDGPTFVDKVLHQDITAVCILYYYITYFYGSYYLDRHGIINDFKNTGTI